MGNNKEYAKQYYQENRDKLLQQSEEYQQNHLEKHAEYSKVYYEKNKDEIRQKNREYRRTYYKKNREIILKKKAMKYYRKKIK